ncbi:hypothetical protein QQF64_027778, partial [Cirrhinus molitorella]
MSTISPTDFDSVEIQQQYNDINNRWDIAAETEWDNENSSARLFERSRIKALAAAFVNQVQYSNILEGRFKQLQGKTSTTLKVTFRKFISVHLGYINCQFVSKITDLNDDRIF